MAEVHQLLSKLLLRLASAAGTNLSEGSKRSLLEESVKEERLARPGVARFHWFGGLRDEDAALRFLDDKQARLRLWREAVAKLRLEMRQGRVVTVDRELAESHLHLSKSLSVLERPDNGGALYRRRPAGQPGQLLLEGDA